MKPDVSLLATTPPAALPLEIVERKGLGHPDTICDAIAEQLSIDLSLAYLDRFGVIQHVIADRAAGAVVADVPGVIEAQCFLLNRVGSPVAEPQVFEVKVRLADPGALAALAPSIVERAEAELARWVPYRRRHARDFHALRYVDRPGRR